MIDAQPVSDSRWYYERGLDFAAGRGYTVRPDAYWPHNLIPATLTPKDEFPIAGRSTAFWPVGYPAVLGILFFVTGPSLLVAKLANILLYMGVLFFSYLIAKQLFASEVAGRLTVLILAFYPEHIAYSSLLETEIPFLFLLLLGIILLVKANDRLWPAVGAGIVFGLGCLVKPQLIFVPALFFAINLYAAIRQERLKQHLRLMAIVYIALGLTILPWLARNYRVFNRFIFISTNGGYNLLLGNNPYATGAYVFNEQIVSMLDDVETEPERNQKAFKLAFRYMAEHPVKTVKLWPSKLWHLYRRDASGVVWNERGLNPISSTEKTFLYWFAKLSQGYYMLIGTAFFVSLFLFTPIRKSRKKPRPWPTLGLWIGLYFTAIYVLTFGDSRFHFPIMPWIVMYVAALGAMLIKQERQITAVTSNVARESL